MSEYIEAIYENTMRIRRIAEYLDTVSHALGITGNKELAGKLAGQSDRLLSIEKNIRDAATDQVEATLKAQTKVLDATMSALVGK